MAPIPVPETYFGLSWTSNLWGDVPAWSEEPHIPTIASLSCQHLGAENLSVESFASGAFHKLYTITAPDQKSEYIFRVTLPLQPFYKTASEVATLRFLRRYTSIPVPEVIAYDSSTTGNKLQFEWILMEKVPGVCLKDIWKDLDFEAKKTITAQVGGYLKQLRSGCKFTAMGNLYQRTQLGDDDLKSSVDTHVPDFVIGPVVMNFLFSGRRKVKLEKDLGPYRGDREYLQALIQLELDDMKLVQALYSGGCTIRLVEVIIAVDNIRNEIDAKRVDSGAEKLNRHDKGIAKDPPGIINLVQQLERVLPSIFPEGTQTPDQFTLYHHDFSLGNIMLDPTSLQITGIVDWESVHTVPTWEDVHPEFLCGKEVEEQPRALDPGEKDGCVEELWEDWEKGHLRKFLDDVVPLVANDEVASLKRGFRQQLDDVECFPNGVRKWLYRYTDEVKGGSTQ